MRRRYTQTFMARRKMSATQKRLWQDPAYRQRMRKPTMSQTRLQELAYWRVAYENENRLQEMRKTTKPLRPMPLYWQLLKEIQEGKRTIEEASREYTRRRMGGCQMKPNRAERKLDAILQEICPDEFALNVKANIMVLGGKIPDFVNVNGRKKLIELYGDYWHRNDNPQDRIDYLRQFGWETLIIWERELKDEAKLKQKLLAFVNQQD